MSRSASDAQAETDADWGLARNQLFGMIMEGRSFSGRERNCCFLNLEGERFATISAVSGLDFDDDARAVGLTDWDQDGRLDMWISNRNAPRLRFMKNVAPANHHFLALRLTGNGTTTNRDAIGARVTVEYVDSADGQGQRAHKSLRAGEGFMSQSSKWLHFGLAKADTIQKIIVRWPAGQTEEFTGAKINQRFQLVQGSGVAKLNPPVATSRSIEPAEQTIPVQSMNARIFLESRVKMPTVEFSTPNGPAQQESFDTGKPTLVNVWASWCSPCLIEMKELAEKKQELENVGIQVLSLSVDQLSDPPTSKSDVAGVVQGLEYPYVWGFIDQAQMTQFQEMQNLFFFLRQPLPLPTSFLVDRSGRLAAIYKGPVTVEQIVHDVQVSPKSAVDVSNLVAQLPGRSIDHPIVHAVAKRSDALTRHRIASWLEESGKNAEAIEHFQELAHAHSDWELPHRTVAKLLLDQNRINDAGVYAEKALQLNPKSSDAHNSMGLIYSRAGNLESAESHFKQAIRLDRDSPGAFNNLGIASAMQGKLDIAEKCFAKAVELDPDFAQAHINLGNVYAGTKQSEKAKKHYEIAIQLDPQNIEPYNNLGTMYGRLGELQKAIECYQASLRIDPDNPATQRNLSKAMELLNSKTNR